MSVAVESALEKDLREAKSALARHGVVIMRTIEAELEPAMMAEVRRSMESSPRKLSKLSDEELDDLMEKTRKAAASESKALKKLYKRLLMRIGTKQPREIMEELEGIGQLFVWERMAQSAGPVNETLEEAGFEPIELAGAEILSDAFKLELEERWPAAFQQFKTLAELAVEHMKKLGEARKAALTKSARKRKR
jgi:hypothetical protein